MAFNQEAFLAQAEAKSNVVPFDQEAFLKERVEPEFGSYATDYLVEAGNMGEMILALPEIVGGAGGTLLGGALDFIEEQGNANYRESELEKRLADGEDIPREEHVRILSEISDVTFKNSFVKQDKIQREAAAGEGIVPVSLNVGSNLGSVLEWSSKQLGLEEEYKEFKENYEDRIKLSATTYFMTQIGEGLEASAEDIEKSTGLPKEATMALVELILLKTNSIGRGVKSVADKTGATSLTKRAGDVVGLKTSDLARDTTTLNKIKNDKAGFKEGKTEAGLRAEAFERKMEATQYGPVLRQNKGELPSDYTGAIKYFDGLKENIDGLETKLRESKTQEEFELAMANIAKQQMQTDKIVIKEVYQNLQGKYIKERGKKAYDEFLKKAELKQEGQDIKFDKLQQEIWDNVYVPIRKFNELGTSELAKNKRLEYNDITIDPKVAGPFQPRIYMQKATSWLGNIVENVTGSRVRGKNQLEGEVAAFGEQRNAVAATREQEYFVVDRPVPKRLFEMMNNWKKGKDIIRTSQVKATRPDGSLIIDKSTGEVVMKNRGIFQEFSRFLWLANQLNVFPAKKPQIYGMMKSFAGKNTSMVKALSQLDKAKKDLVKYNQKYAGVVETKLMKLEYERI